MIQYNVPARGTLYVNEIVITSTGTNTRYGYEALDAVTSGTNNNAFGKSALKVITTGNACTAMGSDALRFATGSNNTAIGRLSLYANSSGYSNSAFGYQSGRSLTTGYKNVFIGMDAGYNGSQLITAQNSIAIGAETYTTANNQVIIGNSSITEVKFSDGAQATFSSDASDAATTQALVNKIKDWMIDNKLMAAS